MNDEPNNTEHFKTLLLDQKKELEERMQKIKNDLYRKDGPISQDFSEQATETENDQVIEELARVTDDQIKHINNALIRIDLGTYGVCVNCGEDISKKRLEVMPMAEYCSDCP